MELDLYTVFQEVLKRGGYEKVGRRGGGACWCRAGPPTCLPATRLPAPAGPPTCHLPPHPSLLRAGDRPVTVDGFEALGQKGKNVKPFKDQTLKPKTSCLQVPDLKLWMDLGFGAKE